MQTHRIRELREAKGWTQSQLAGAVGLAASAISKLENGQKLLRADEVQKIADALGVSVNDVMGSERRSASDFDPAMTGFRDDIATYKSTDDDPFRFLQTDNRYLMHVASDALSKIGVGRGDLVIIDGSAAAVKRIKPLDLVRVQYHPDAADLSKAVSLLRQFVPPSLLITNSAHANAPTLDMDVDDAQILGVVVSVHRALQS